MSQCFVTIFVGVALAVLAGSLRAQESLLMEIRWQTPAVEPRYSTRDARPEQQLVQVVTGSTTRLQRQSGVDYELRSSYLGLPQGQQVAHDVEAFSVTPGVEGDMVIADLSVTKKRGSERFSFDTRLLGQIGEWLVVLPEQSASQSSHSYSKRSSSHEAPALYLRFTRSR